MRLAFYAKPDHMVNRPGMRSVGAPPRYVGREHVAVNDKAGGVAGTYPATAEPEVFELKDGAPEAFDLMRSCRKGGIWAADKATAVLCGVEFMDLEREKDSGEWVPKAKRNAPTPKAALSNEPKE